MVDIGLAEVTPGRQVNVAEDQWVSRGFMVLDHMGIDKTAAVDLRLGSIRQGSAPTKVCSWTSLHPNPLLCSIPHSKTDTPNFPRVFHSLDKVESHSGLLQVWGLLPPNEDTRTLVSQHKTWLMTHRLRQYLRWTWMVSVIEARAPDCGGRSRASMGGGSPRRERVQAAIDSEMDVRL